MPCVARISARLPLQQPVCGSCGNWMKRKVLGQNLDCTMLQHHCKRCLFSETPLCCQDPLQVPAADVPAALQRQLGWQWEAMSCNSYPGQAANAVFTQSHVMRVLIGATKEAEPQSLLTGFQGTALVCSALYVSDTKEELQV